MAANSLNLKERAAVRCVRLVAQGIGSTYCLGNIAICWEAKVVDATDCRTLNLCTEVWFILQSQLLGWGFWPLRRNSVRAVVST